MAIQSKQKSSFQLSFDDHEQISSNFGFRYSAKNIGQNATKKINLVINIYKLLTSYTVCLCSSVVEHWSRKPGVMGSIPIGGIFYFKQIFILYSSKGCRSWQGSNLRGQSPLDFKSNALTTRPQLPRLIPAPNTGQKVWRCGGSNPGPFTCKANALPLSYIP